MTADLISPQEAAAMLKLSLMTVYRMIHDGRLPAVRVGERKLRIPRKAIANLLKPVSVKQ